jgi:hypothetical protein
MTIDVTGGLGDEREYVFDRQPDDPEMRESVNAWVWDDGDAVGIPRFGIEAVGDQWETHEMQVNMALAGGRVVTLFRPGKVHDPLGADGRPRTLGAGGLSFELIEPYRHWRARLEGTGTEITAEDQINGWVPGGEGRPVPIELELDIRSAAPPWEPGTLLEEAGRVLVTQEEGALMGGPRFEQLSRVTGRIRVGDEEHQLRGGGLRIRRQGVRRLATFRGHAWQSAVFPSGRGFGYITYPPRDDGKPTFNEGYVFEGDGPLVPARVVEAPWLTDLAPRDQVANVVLETATGTTAIQGRTILSTCMVMGPLEGFKLQQAITRYTWDGETANGMLERSTAAS